MTAYALITGTLHKDPATRTSSAGNEFVTATIKFQQKARDGSTETLFVSVSAFRDEAQSVLGRLKAGDAVSVGGTLQLGIWERDGVAHPSLSMMADTVAAARPRPKPKRNQARGMEDMDALYSRRLPQDQDDFNDPISF
jgi:single-stranded DNA-binding protein